MKHQAMLESGDFNVMEDKLTDCQNQIIHHCGQDAGVICGKIIIISLCPLVIHIHTLTGNINSTRNSTRIITNYTTYM